jgi:hypothetical protein
MMTPHNTDILQALKWLQNEAPNIQSIISQKAEWYDRNHFQFWDDWYQTVFNIDTASDFGLIVWCIILGVNTEPFSFDPIENAWGYGANRENFIFSGTPGSLTDPNLIGGNFIGGGAGSIVNLDEIRRLLKLRYVALTHNGTLAHINYMLREIFNDGEPWDFANGNYFYAMDVTGSGNTSNAAIKRLYEKTAAEGEVTLQEVTRNQGLADSGWTGVQTTVDIQAAVPEFPSTYSVIRMTAQSISSGAQFMGNQTNAVAGRHVFQALLKTSGVNQVVMQVTNTASLASQIVIDIGAASIISVEGEYVDFGIEQLANGYVKVWLCVDIAAINPIARFWMADSGRTGIPIPAGAYVTVVAPMLALGSDYGKYVKRPTSSVVTQKDYTLTASTGALAMGYTMASNAELFWSGGFKGADTIFDVKVGQGDGSTTAFIIPTPPNSTTKTATPMLIEYRLGQNAGVSDQSLVILADPESGITPAPAGVRYTMTKV